jgi:hypothetical protein
MINQMSSSMRNFMEAYSAVHNKEAKEEFYSHKDEISEMDFSLINQTELDDIAEEVLEELFEEGYSVEQCEAIFEEVLIEARVTYGSDTESPRAKKMSAVKSSLEDAMGKVKEKAARTAVKSYGAYRSAKQSATDKAKRLEQGAKYKTAAVQRAATNAKYVVKRKFKDIVRRAADKVGDTANKVSSRMSEGTIRKDIGDIYQAIYEKKMDAVGQEDADIDNDGDTDSSDEYLANRRKAIGKSMGKKGKCEKCGKEPCECDKKEVEEGYKELPKNKMFRKAGNLGRDVVSPSVTDDQRQKAYDRSKKIVKTLNKANEEVTFSESELEAIQAKVDAWDVEEGYQRNPEKGEAEARKSETSGQKSERNVRDRLKTMDPKKAEAMKKQMRAVGLNV